MRIIHVKMTPIAGAPDLIASCINRYTDNSCRLWYSHHGHDGDLAPYHEERADLLHFHNMYKNTIKPSVIQYHSEPLLAMNEGTNKGLSLNPPSTCKKLVVAQYHAGLDVYKTCVPVRNIIDFEHELYTPKAITDKIRIGYSPSITENGFGIWHYKGFRQTDWVLKFLSKRIPNVEFDIITGGRWI